MKTFWYYILTIFISYCLPSFGISEYFTTLLGIPRERGAESLPHNLFNYKPYFISSIPNAGYLRDPLLQRARTTSRRNKDTATYDTTSPPSATQGQSHICIPTHT